MSDRKPQVIRLTREELYEQVWKMPMRLLAKSYGISGVGLAKVCKRHKIPRPSLGYWAKKQIGKAPRRPALPAIHDSMLERVEFMGCPWRDTSEPRRFFDPQIADLVAAEAQKRIVILEHLRAPHPFGVATRAWYQQRSERRGPHQGAPQKPCVRDWSEALDIDVTENTLGRALRIIDALLKAFEARGYTVRLQNAEWKRTTAVNVLGEESRFCIRERLRLAGHPPTLDQAKGRGSNATASRPSARDLVRSGVPELNVLEGGTDLCPLRSWRDTDQRPLEDRLSGVIPYY